jgi:hypothetical protein
MAEKAATASLLSSTPQPATLHNILYECLATDYFDKFIACSLG